ncbi:hypothetical protein L873DRAFT_870773 [Choiromyces venosus 120613-1]|uniref:Uncharacterized protein n=1 Tax=Choiromyces venosus 120613-1 TaxID=1336337 RepID=A0A3N4IRZ6_9PEZI|nr:hypothetical protein L873DRAFT_870773 [Choiromyces venosus 120613-1]
MLAAKPQGKTTSMSKRGQILAYATLEGSRKMTLEVIANETGILKSTCSNIIREAKKRSLETGNNDLCMTENLTPKPNCEKGSVITKQEKDYLVRVTLADSAHCRMSYTNLAHEARLQICGNTVKKNSCQKQYPPSKTNREAATKQCAACS